MSLRAPEGGRNNPQQSEEIASGASHPRNDAGGYSTVTLLAKFLGWSTSHPRLTAM